MADQENCARVTRLATKKRAAAEAMTSQQQQNKKKRVVLGEIQNFVAPLEASNKNSKQNLENQKQKKKPNRKVKKPVEIADVSVEEEREKKSVEGEDDVGIDVNAKSDDPQMCAAYVSGIYEYLHKMEMEAKRRPVADYLEKVQKDVTANMRGILVDWLVEVAEEYKLLSDTLYLSVSYIDRFLSLNAINRQRLQLLGVASMLIASKYEEINPPHLEDFVYITDNTYTKEEMVKMESDVLNSLKFEMGNPTVKTFLR
ncbi:unnamed protein product [Fraxinus pennsylvanica]|uniref:Cyclin-like domain-containing protein n=1 Tax=Fraxinus pennsylvanica TaxID=56036 RepID=A0AAD2DT91_9LAMI|nr:unnamed protein product [Fraxinus pennsylvanica]